MTGSYYFPHTPLDEAADSYSVEKRLIFAYSIDPTLWDLMQAGSTPYIKTLPVSKYENLLQKIHRLPIKSFAYDRQGWFEYFEDGKIAMQAAKENHPNACFITILTLRINANLNLSETQSIDFTKEDIEEVEIYHLRKPILAYLDGDIELMMTQFNQLQVTSKDKTTDIIQETITSPAKAIKLRAENFRDDCGKFFSDHKEALTTAKDRQFRAKPPCNRTTSLLTIHVDIHADFKNNDFVDSLTIAHIAEAIVVGATSKPTLLLIRKPNINKLRQQAPIKHCPYKLLGITPQISPEIKSTEADKPNDTKNTDKTALLPAYPEPNDRPSKIKLAFA